jgi:hypothetical protein
VRPTTLVNDDDLIGAIMGRKDKAERQGEENIPNEPGKLQSLRQVCETDGQGLLLYRSSGWRCHDLPGFSIQVSDRRGNVSV